MQALSVNQLSAFDKLRKFKVGALFMEPGTGKTRAAYELVQSVPECDYIIWLTPFQTKTNLSDELSKCGSLPIDIVGIESLSSSDRLYLSLINRLESAKCPFIVVDESLKIKNWDAIRTQRIIKLGSMAQYKLVLNGTPLSKNLLDLWAQMEFLSPRILRMGLAEFKNTFCEWVKVTKRIGSKCYTNEYIKDYHNIDYLYSLINHYVYECDLSLNVDRMYSNINYEIDSDTIQRYNHLKEYYLDDERILAMNNNIFLELTQKMQHLYCCSPDKFIQTRNIIDGNDPSKVLIFCKFIDSRVQCSTEFNNVRTLSYGMHSFGLNLQDYSIIIFFDKTFDYAQRLQAERRIYRIGQNNNCHYYDLTGNVNLEKMIDCNINKKTSLLNYFKQAGVKAIHEL